MRDKQMPLRYLRKGQLKRSRTRIMSDSSYWHDYYSILYSFVTRNGAYELEPNQPLVTGLGTRFEPIRVTRSSGRLRRLRLLAPFAFLGIGTGSM